MPVLAHAEVEPVAQEYCVPPPTRFGPIEKILVVSGEPQEFCQYGVVHPALIVTALAVFPVMMP
jgi:hypothetical protein